MVTFLEFSKRLARGQLKNASCVDDNTPGTISAERIDEILEYVNQGLVDLSTRQALITKTIDLTFVDAQHTYVLSPDSVGSYLDATETDEFTDNFVKVIEIVDAEGNKHLTDTTGHIMTPSYNVIRFTTSKMDEIGPKVRIRYQATHEKINTDGSMSIPPNLEIALQLFVASLYLSHMNSEESISKGEKYFGSYLRHLGLDTDRDLSSTSEVEEDTRLEDRGFV